MAGNFLAGGYFLIPLLAFFGFNSSSDPSSLDSSSCSFSLASSFYYSTSTSTSSSTSESS